MDFADDGRPIGIEIPSPARFDVRDLNAALVRRGEKPARPEDLAPLVAT